jgi:hypothetical protein
MHMPTRMHARARTHALIHKRTHAHARTPHARSHAFAHTHAHRLLSARHRARLGFPHGSDPLGSFVQGPLIRARMVAPAARAWRPVIDRYVRPRRKDWRPVLVVLGFVVLVWMRAARTRVA